MKMKMEKHFSYKSPHQIWRILISDSEKLILETRDVNSKEVFFHCFDLWEGTKIFSDFQLEDKYWVGIETVHKDIIYFHKFPKPDLPIHTGIIAFDPASQKILWTNAGLSFLFAYQDKIYGFKQGFEERYFYELDYLDGSLTKEYENDHAAINKLKNQANNTKDWGSYLYPEILKNNSDEKINRLITQQTGKNETAGEVEYNVYNSYLLFSYHSKVFENSLVNKFFAVDLNSEKIVFSEILNANVTAMLTDSFFLYKNLLFLLREKNEVIVYKIE
ncbi:MAG: DUF4905 domain-containing protein [Bacteroidetes bacterium]|nr:DUF4905 domain-containing protein [Bacteroidota bacterium]